MAKTGLRVKAGTQAEVRGARLHPLPALRATQGRLPQSACARNCLREIRLTRASCPA